MADFFDLVACGVGSLSLFSGSGSLGPDSDYTLLDKWYTKDELEMLKSPIGQLAWSFQQTGKAMSGAVADVKQEQGV